MKQIDVLRNISELFVFKTLSDEKGYNFVVFKSSPFNQIARVRDKTEFEAVENHVHLLDGVKKSEFHTLIDIGTRLGQAMLTCLKSSYPDKIFYVFASVTLGDSFIIRFHQNWEGEAPYFDVDNLPCNNKEHVIMLTA